MKIVIVGGGKVGYVLVQQLSKEGHDIVLIDKRTKVLHDSQEVLDVAIVNGNGAAVNIQREAGVQDSDLLIAVTSGDEVNLMCCVVAKMLGCSHTIARVRNPEYDQQISFLKENLGLSMAINPEKLTAQETLRLLQFPSFLKRDSFANGRVELVEFKLEEANPLVGRSLGNISNIWTKDALICAVERDAEVTIPSGAFSLEAGDKLTIASDATKLGHLLHNVLKVNHAKITKVMIVGGSKIAAYLASVLTATHVEVTLIENDYDRCMELSQIVPQATIINGDGTSQSLLLSEGIEQVDALVTLTGIDEENLIISMFANSLGIPKSITKINRIEYMEVFSKMGIDTIVSPKNLTANQIIRYVRAMSATDRTNNGVGAVETLYKIVGGKAEALGFTADKEMKYLNIPFSNLPIKPNILIASIMRNNHVIIPKGNDCIQAGDSVVVVTTSNQTVANLSDIFHASF